MTDANGFGGHDVSEILEFLCDRAFIHRAGNQVALDERYEGDHERVAGHLEKAIRIVEEALTRADSKRWNTLLRARWAVALVMP